MKTCPYCAEEIQDAAIVCKHCGRDLVETTGNDNPVYRYSKGGGLFSITVYPNRITIEDSLGGGVRKMIAPQVTDIMIKNISGINLKGFMRNVEITMNDGTLRKIPMIYTLDAEKFRNAVLRLL